MKKILISLLLMPMIVFAEGTMLDIECDNIKDNDDTLKCVINLNNEKKSQINSISFYNQDNFTETNSKFEMSLLDNTYKINLNQNNSPVIELLNFKVKVPNNNIGLTFKNILIDLHGETDIKITELKKELKVFEKAKLKEIYINDTKVEGFDPNKYEYEISTYEDMDYYELQAIPNNNSSVLKGYERKLLKFNKFLNIEVENENDKETYNIKFIEKDQKDLIKDIKIEEFDCYFKPTKFNYYLEVDQSINTLHFRYDNLEKIVTLTQGKNDIEIKNDNVTYTYSIYRAKNIDEKSNSLKSLKIGDKQITLKDKVYDYQINESANNLVDITFFDADQDYDIEYKKDCIIINLYGKNGQKNTYKIVQKTETIEKIENTPIDYDKTSTIIIFIVFMILAIGIGFILIKKYLKNKQD